MLKKNIIFLLICFVFQSCCTKVWFDKEEQRWYNMYSQGDILIFKSNRLNLDTIKITEVKEIEPNGECNWIEISNFSKERVIITYQYTFDNKKWIEEDLFDFTKEDDDRFTIPFIKVKGLFVGYNLEDNLKKSKKDVYLFEIGEYSSTKYTKMKHGVDTDIVQFYWELDKGLVQYENNKGEVWELKEHIKANGL